MEGSLSFRFREWISHKVDNLTRLRIILLLAVLWCLGRGLVVTTPSARSGWLGITILLAVLLGWLLGRSSRSAWSSALVGLLVAPVWLSLSVGDLAKPLASVLASFAVVLFSFLRPPHLPSFSPFLISFSSLVQSSVALFARFPMWINNLQAASPVRDPTVEGFLWGLGMWMAACWAAWWLRRRSMVEIALLPVALLFIIPIFFTRGKEYLPWLVLFAGGWVFLQALEHYVTSRHRWQEKKMDRVEIEPGLVGSVIFIVVIGMLLGGFIPGISLDKLHEAWDDLFEPQERISEGTGEGATGGKGGFTTYMKISAGQQLDPDIILYIRVEGYSAPPPTERGRSWEAQQSVAKYSWRKTTYSTYNGSSWSNYTSREQEFPASSPVYSDPSTALDLYDFITQSVERLNPVDNSVYFTGDLLSVDQPISVSWRRQDDFIQASTSADTYMAESRLPRVTVSQLRQAGGDLPKIIRDRYLQLPDDLPDRVRDLALDLTVGLDNSYDRALVIQDYLRQFPYNLDVPAPPPGRDAVDYFLFDLQQGYCNYYASAMSVLARAAGLPARVVTGYRTGGYDYLNQRFIIREENSHAWVEVYFPGIGWIEFEPTRGVPTFSRLGGATGLTLPATPVPAGAAQPATSLNWSVLRHPLVLLGFLAVALLVISLVSLRERMLYLQPTETVLSTIFKRLYRQGRRWEIPFDGSRTPLEFARLLSARLDTITGQSMSPDLLYLTRLYTLQLFSPVAPMRTDIQQAIGVWLRLQRVLRRPPRRVHSPGG